MMQVRSSLIYPLLVLLVSALVFVVSWRYPAPIFSEVQAPPSSLAQELRPEAIFKAFADNASGTCAAGNCVLDGPSLEGEFAFLNTGQGVYRYPAVYRFAFTAIGSSPPVLEGNVVVDIVNPADGRIGLQYLYELFDYGADGVLDEIRISAIQPIVYPSGRSSISKLPRGCWVRGGSPGCINVLGDTNRDGIITVFEEYLLKTLRTLEAAKKIARGDRI